MATQQKRTKPDEVTLVKGDDTRTVRSVDDVVRLKFDGYTVKSAGAESVAAPKSTPKSADQK
jgi:hypothetical protein